MALKKELTIVIQPDGTVELETSGFKGGECETEVKAFEKSLGPATEKKRTKEYYEKPVVQRNRKIGSQTE
ncbi:MAG: DUF2997 domain-containing protein [Oligoflexia bacterium]|nr:DUF2997 domain-containing protein [Oligoflexia bacterium]